MSIFAMGCNPGPNKAARHLAGNVTPHMLSYTKGFMQISQAPARSARSYLGH